MIRNLDGYYKKEIFTWWFLSLLPFLFLMEVITYFFTTPGRDYSLNLMLQLIAAISGVTGLVLFILQVVSNVKFHRDILQLPPEMREAVGNEIPRVIKRGRYLLTKDILIYYGMFVKKVYKRRVVSRWRRNKGIYSQFVPKAGHVRVSYDNTVIYLKNQFGYMDMIEYPVDPLESKEETKGELPYNAFLAAFVSMVFTVSMILYPRILMDAATGTGIEKFLFYSVHEVNYCLAAILITAGAGLVAFIIRCILKPINLKKDKVTARNWFILSGILLVVTAMFITGFLGSWHEEAALAREDLAAYYAGDFCTAEGRYKVKESFLQNEVGVSVYNYAKQKSFQPVLLDNPGRGLVLLKSAFDELPEEGKRYRVEYLKNTKIVVSFSKP